MVYPFASVLLYAKVEICGVFKKPVELFSELVIRVNARRLTLGN